MGLSDAGALSARVSLTVCVVGSPVPYAVFSILRSQGSQYCLLALVVISPKVSILASRLLGLVQSGNIDFLLKLPERHENRKISFSP